MDVTKVILKLVLLCVWNRGDQTIEKATVLVNAKSKSLVAYHILQ